MQIYEAACVTIPMQDDLDLQQERAASHEGLRKGKMLGSKTLVTMRAFSVYAGALHCILKEQIVSHFSMWSILVVLQRYLSLSTWYRYFPWTMISIERTE